MKKEVLAMNYYRTENEREIFLSFCTELMNLFDGSYCFLFGPFSSLIRIFEVGAFSSKMYL